MSDRAIELETRIRKTEIEFQETDPKSITHRWVLQCQLESDYNEYMKLFQQQSDAN